MSLLRSSAPFSLTRAALSSLYPTASSSLSYTPSASSSTALSAASSSSSSDSPFLLSHSSSCRPFSTTSPALKKSHRARGATRKSPRNQALLASISSSSTTSSPSSSKPTPNAANQASESESKALTLEQACELLQSSQKKPRPMNAFELHVVTTVSTHQTNALRGRINFPRDPRLKKEKLLIFAEEGSPAAEAAKSLLSVEIETLKKTAEKLSVVSEEGEGVEKKSEGGAESEGPSIILGGSELISSVLNNRVSGYTKVLCTNTILGELSRSLARSLGPKGLMPNPRRGTVVPADDAKAMEAAIREARGGADWRSDKVGVIRGAVGRLHFSPKEVRENVTTLLDAVINKVPTLGQSSSQNPGVGGAASVYVKREPRSPNELRKASSIIKQVHLSSTQGPGVLLDLKDVLA
ncbi:ribosomal protein L1 [Violaceomyces palustris]|uniref:Ribosomal protein L1 n=1 Tax=Violaceomyces palustris TaxID=1673888 RepID=A0ACD0P1W2_9BASI|nr:ribosomal protein L1 [Violaceomyces palustris]